ncbi:MAG: hypothetical protein AABY07_07425 [Nanoarchaeota archaeon]
MSLTQLLRKEKEHNVASLRFSTATEVDLHNFGIEKTPLGYDAGALLLALYEFALREFYSKIRRATIETCFMSDGKDWIHSNFDMGRYTESHLFRIDATSDGLEARVRSNKDDVKVLSEIWTTVNRSGMPYQRLFSIEHTDPIDGLWWPVPNNFLIKGPFKTGQFYVTRNATSIDTAQIAKRTGVRIFEMFRHILRESDPGHLSLKFPTRYDFTVSLSIFGVDKVDITKGFFVDNERFKVAYIGLADKNKHPPCAFDRIESKAGIYFG